MMEQAAPRPCVPIGYRFKPTPEELIRFYLNPWVVTGKHAATADLFPAGVVCVADIYASDPDALTSRFQHYAHDGYWYFLCVARWKGGKVGTRMNRCVQGGGTWHGSSSRKVVGRDGHHQGFEYRLAGNVKTVWIMEEFVTSLKEATDGEGVKVICRVCVSRKALADVEEETDEVVAGSNNQQLPPHGEHDVERSDVASTAHQGGLMMTTDAGVKRARLDGDHGLAAYPSVSVAAPSPAECYAGTWLGAPESAAVSNTTWQQSMMEQGMGVDGEPEPLAMVESAGMEGLPLLWATPPDVEEETNIVVGSYKQLLLHGDYDVERSDIASTAHQAGLLMMTDAGVKRARFDGEHGLAAYPSVSVAAPSPAEYYAGTWESAPVSNTTWQQSMMEQGVESDGMGIDGEPEPLAVVESAGMGIDGEPEALEVVESTGMGIDGEPEPLDVVESAGIGGLPVPPMDDDLDLTSLYEQVNLGLWDSLDFRV